MVDCNNKVEMDMDMLVMFKCPSFEKAGLMCVFSSMKDNVEPKKGLRCRSQACAIRLPEKAVV